MPELGWSRYMRDVEIPSVFNARVNASVVEDVFLLVPPIDEMWVVNRMIVNIRSGAPFEADRYGNLPALTNGISLELGILGGETITDFTDGKPVKSNGDWGALCFDIHPVQFGAGDNFFLARWTFTNDGAPIYLRGVERHVLRVILRDDLSGLQEHTFKCGGYTKTEGWT